MAINNNIDAGRLNYLLTLQAYTIEAIDKKLITPQFGTKFLNVFNTEARNHIGQEMSDIGNQTALDNASEGDSHG